VVASAAHAPDLRNHLEEILQSPMFKASPRSQHLLKYVVEKSLDGDFDLLKERLIGTELFGRPSGYDTGEDAIVRVAASDVRKRLLQFYGTGGAHGAMRIDLPPGSYIPAFCVAEGGARGAGSASAAAETPGRTGEGTDQSADKSPTEARTWIRAAIGLTVVVAIGLGLWMVARGNGASAAPPKSLPWSALFSKTAGQTDIILSDTNVSALQFWLDCRVPLSDYANRQYLAKCDRPLSPEMQRVARELTGIEYTAPTAAVDAVMVLRVAQIAGPYASRIRARPARSLQLRDFESDDNFILLGSPSSNPWGALFAEQLDFAFDYDKELKGEFLRNNRPQAGELARYVPTALGGATGRTFGIIGFLRNPNHGGHVLLVAGTTAEATEAATRLVADPAALSAVLQRYGIAEAGPPRHFEVLLSVEEMAGAPARSQVVALHILADRVATH
jgi:hypothetical protein